MAEPSKCPYCKVGIPVWIWLEESNNYILQCSECKASGEYRHNKEKEAINEQ
jgi:hypothetical protein